MLSFKYLDIPEGSFIFWLFEKNKIENKKLR